MAHAHNLAGARRIAIIGMLVTAALAVMKILAGWQGHSAAVLADGMESAADVFSTGLVFTGLVLAARPADSNHPYGHGRVEILTGLVLGLTLFGAGTLIAWTSLSRFGNVEHAPEPWTIYPLLISIVAKFVLMVVKYRHSKGSGSFSMKADAAHDGIDMVSGVVALVALSFALLRPESFGAADHYGAFAVGLIVMFTAVRVVREASMHLMDTMPDDLAMLDVRTAAMAVDGVRGVEKCFARKTGLQYHVDLHLEVDPEITVRESHEIAQRVRFVIRGKLEWVADVLVHVEPWPGNNGLG